MGCCFGGLCVSDLEIGDVRGLSSLVGYATLDGMVAVVGDRRVRGVDAAEHDARSLAMEDLDEWCE